MIRLSQLILIISLLPGSVVAQTETVFTYQGSLSEAGEPANGTFDLEFGLWDAASGGNRIGVPQVLNNTPVTGGLFTVQLDFAADALDNSARWLEIAVNSTTLDPRQPVTRAPYAIQTRGIFVDANHHVGIGTTTPAWELEVANLNPGDGAESAVTADDASGAVAAYSSSLPPPFDHLGGRVSLFANAVTPGLDLRADASNGDVRFYTGGPLPTNERMRITEGGNVGIGTTATIWELEVADATAGGSAESVVSADDAGGGLAAYSSTYPSIPHFADRFSLWSDGITATGLDLRADGSTSDMRFYTGGWAASNERMRITEDGRVGIGTTNPTSYSLHIEASDRGAIFVDTHDGDGIVVEANGDFGYAVYGSGLGDRSTGVLGMAGPPGTVNYGVYGISHSQSGYDFYAGGIGQDYGASSSIRWKRNIELIDDPLEKVAQLRGVYFDWDEEHGGHHDVGMIAEEVGAVLPEIVTYDENRIDAHGMDYSKLTPLLVEAVNALRGEKDSEIDALRAEKDAEITELRQRISDLEQLVEGLQSRSGADGCGTRESKQAR